MMEDLQKWFTFVGSCAGFLALFKITRWPRMYFKPRDGSVFDGPEDGSRVLLTIGNDHPQPLVVTRIHIIGRNAKIGVFPDRGTGEAASLKSMRDNIGWVTDRTINIFVPANDQREALINLIKPDTAVLLVVWWNRGGLFRIPFPTVLLLTGAHAAALANG